MTLQSIWPTLNISIDLISIETQDYQRKFVLFGKRSPLIQYENMQNYYESKVLTIIPIDKNGMKIILQGE